MSNISGGGGGNIPFPQANSPAICSCLPCLICFFAGEKEWRGKGGGWGNYFASVRIYNVCIFMNVMSFYECLLYIFTIPIILQYYSSLRGLKVPKCEIFDRSDFPDFYTIKSRREGDFGVKIKKF